MYILWNIIDKTIISNEVPRRDALQHRVFLYMFVSLQFHPTLDATLNNTWLVVWNIFYFPIIYGIIIVWKPSLVGCLEHILFSPIVGMMTQSDLYFSTWLKPSTRYGNHHVGVVGVECSIEVGVDLSLEWFLSQCSPGWLNVTIFPNGNPKTSKYQGGNVSAC